jgi:hypothetical protein
LTTGVLKGGIYRISKDEMTDKFIMVPEPGRECCDFCCLESVHKVFACTNFMIPDMGPAFTHESIGARAACEECARLIDGNRWSELTERALGQFQRLHGYTRDEEPFFRNKFQEIHQLFRDHMIKEVWKMLSRNNKGEIASEMNTTITQEGTVIRTNTMYNNGRPVAQNISVRDTDGKVRTTNVLGGKILP